MTTASSDPNVCRICGERFRLPEFAARCLAQGVPKRLYHTGDVLMKNGTEPMLVVIENVDVHHGSGKCPVDGPCEHAVTYKSYRMYLHGIGTKRSWISCLATDRTSQEWLGLKNVYQRVARFSMDWGMVDEDHDPSVYLIGGNIQEDWARLWEPRQPARKKRAPKAQQRLALPKTKSKGGK